MRPLINVTTKKDNDTIQIVTIINYSQNSLSSFLKQLITEPKLHQIKPILQKHKLALHNIEIRDFASMRLDNKSTRKGKRAMF